MKEVQRFLYLALSFSPSPFLGYVDQTSLHAKPLFIIVLKHTHSDIP